MGNTFYFITRLYSFILDRGLITQPEIQYKMSSNSSDIEWNVKKVRSTFINYFVEKHNHIYIPSSRTIPLNDPTLLFANSGMAQFKSIFQGTVDRDSSFGKLVRATNSQKCIRAGGKHNDLDDVGKDTYHHTFFEMLGNWSFGDYFKKEAVFMAWDLLTNVYKLPGDRLYVTYFGGDKSLGLEPDLEAKKLWLDIGVAEDHILPGSVKDNFWEMGDQGPCGPCSEIHFDRIGGRNASELVNMDDPDVIEIWNLVFMQFNREADRSLKPLPNKHIDTGMGFERLVSILQNKRSNYDTDVFQGLFNKIKEITNSREYRGLQGAEDVDGIDTAYRVVADHIRTLTFAIADGGYPSNEGRGYVLRRILRRGARYVRKKFNVPIGNFFSRLVDVVIEEMGDFFPEITRRVDELKEILDEEERSFAKTLDRGEKLFGEYLEKTVKNNSKVLDGADVWRLYDTYGFPVDLTRLMAEENNVEIDEIGFEKAQLEAKERSKARSSKETGDVVALTVHDLGALEKNDDVPRTDDSFKYGMDDITSTIKAIHNNGEFVKSVDETSGRFGILLDKTNFYAEQGGQIYDTGDITIDGKAHFFVEDVQVFGGYVLHIGFIKFGSLNVGDDVTCSYDELRRWPIRNNHTGTHILNFALRDTLGDVVDQKGSLVAPTKLRFDFSAKGSVSPAELSKIETICNDVIAKNLTVYAQEVGIAVGKTINGLRAVFGETYPDPVRVVSVGFDIKDILADPSNKKWETSSIEFCGGTHVKSTGDIKRFVIMEESSISKGIRRIVAVTGDEATQALDLLQTYQERVDDLKRPDISAESLDAKLRILSRDLLEASIPIVAKGKLLDEFNAIKKAFNDKEKVRKTAEMKEAVEIVKKYFDENPEAGFMVGKLPFENNNKALAKAIEHIKSINKAGLLISLDSANGKVSHQCVVPKELIGSEFTATAWANVVSQQVGGKNGGKPEAAAGAGTEISKVEDAINLASEFALLKLSK